MAHKKLSLGDRSNIEAIEFDDETNILVESQNNAQNNTWWRQYIEY